MSLTYSIGYNKLLQRDKWLLKSFLSAARVIEHFKYPEISIGDVLVPRKGAIEPQNYPTWKFTYLGLEHVESHSGFLVNYQEKLGEEIKSRSKIFYAGDMLYGKLRPNLNKIFIADDDFKGGICSNEYFVLKLNENVVRPYFLKFVLSSQYVLNQIHAFTAGAALPRIHIDDFLSIKIPMPPLNEVIEIDQKFKALLDQIWKHKYYVDQSANFLELTFNNLFVNGLQEDQFNLADIVFEKKLPIGGLPESI